jgi:hypothetical protein
MQDSFEATHTELEEQLRFETILAEISSRFVNVPAGEVDREIEDAQRRMTPDVNSGHETFFHAAACLA